MPIRPYLGQNCSFRQQQSLKRAWRKYLPKTTHVRWVIMLSISTRGCRSESSQTELSIACFNEGLWGMLNSSGLPIYKWPATTNHWNSIQTLPTCISVLGRFVMMPIRSINRPWSSTTAKPILVRPNHCSINLNRNMVRTSGSGLCSSMLLLSITEP